MTKRHIQFHTTSDFPNLFRAGETGFEGVVIGVGGEDGGVDELTPPDGFLFVVDGDGAYLTDADGAYIITGA